MYFAENKLFSNIYNKLYMPLCQNMLKLAFILPFSRHDYCYIGNMSLLVGYFFLGGGNEEAKFALKFE